MIFAIQTALARAPGATTVLDQVRLITVLLVVALGVALVSRRLRLPYTLALVLVGLVIGLLGLGPDVRLRPDAVLLIFLPALLFEGAWNVRVDQLAADWLLVLLLAVPGLGISLVVVAAALHWGVGYGWLLALLVGAIVSPTDPVAVLTLLRQLRMPTRLRVIVEGESLFNDGVGAASFTIVLGLLLTMLRLPGGHPERAGWVITLQALWLILGGPALGVAVGMVVGHLLRFVDEHLIEIAVTFSVAYGVFLLADLLGTSGLLAVVSAGLVLGSYGRRVGMSPRTRAAASDVWEFVAYVANSLLFLFLGLQIGAGRFAQELAAVAWAVVGVVVGRTVMIAALVPGHDALARRLARDGRLRPGRWLAQPVPVPESWRPLLLLAGLRGALSIALVLSLPAGIPRLSELDGIVYGIVLVTLLGQGLGLRALLPRWAKAHAAEVSAPGDT